MKPERIQWIKEEDPMTARTEQARQLQLAGWETVTSHDGIERVYRFETFAETINFVLEVATVADEQGHAPDIEISGNEVTLRLGGSPEAALSVADFNVAFELEAIAA